MATTEALRSHNYSCLTALIFQKKKTTKQSLCSLFFEPQIVHDEGPLYVFAKSDDVRAQWIKKLKESKSSFQVFSVVSHNTPRQEHTCTCKMKKKKRPLMCLQWCDSTVISCTSTIPAPGWMVCGCAANRKSNRPWAAGCWTTKMVRMRFSRGASGETGSICPNAQP